MPMIKFFRSVRQRLLNENRFTRYLVYAIGEIFLVVVGILIAIQANNWYENKKKEDKETIYLEGLLGDISNDKVYLENRIERLTNIIGSQGEYLSRSYDKQESIEEVKDLFSLHNLDTDHLTLHTTTYLELLNSGNLNIFQNEDLKKSIIDYYNEGQKLSLEISEYNNVSTEYMVEANRVVKNFVKFYDRNIPIFDDPTVYSTEEWHFINDPSSDEFLSLQAMVWFYRIRNQQYLIYYETLEKQVSQLIKQIKEELNNR